MKTPPSHGRRSGGRVAPALLLALLLAACGADTPQALIASGKEMAAKKDHKAAVIQFKTALQADPGSAEARYLLGKALLDSGDPVAAALELGKAHDQKYDENKVLPAMARAMLLAGDYRKLTTLYGEVKLTDPDAQAALKSSVATAWGALGDREKTEAAIAAALAAQPHHAPARILNARILAGKREFDAAAKIVDQVLAEDPTQYEAWHLKGEIASFGKNDQASADASFRKALEIERAYVPAHLALISARLRARDIPGATAQADALAAVLPKHPQTTFVFAQIAFSNRDYAKARELVQDLLKLSPNHVGVLQLAGAIEGQSGSLVLAETYFSKALQIVPDLPLARRNLAQTYLRLGQVPKALETLQPLLTAGTPDADAHALAGDAYLRLGQAQAAEREFTLAVRISPENLRLRTAAALTLLARGDANAAFTELQTLSEKSPETFADQAIVSARVKRREYDAALEAVNAMVRKDSGNAGVQELRGRVQLARRDHAGAREAFEMALKIDPSMFAATSALAALDMLEHKPDQARKRLEDAIKADPHNHYAYLSLAEVRAKSDASSDELRKILADAVQAAPTDPTARLQLIDLMLRKRMHKEALVAAQEAAAALPGDARVLDAVGRAQMEAGDVEQAVSTFRKLAGVDQNSGAPYTRLADVYLASGKRAAAETALRKALEIEPGLAKAQEALVNLMVAGNRQREVLDLARQMQEREPRNPNGYALEALIQQRTKAIEPALAALRKGLAVPGHDPELARVYYGALARNDRLAEADRFAAGWLRDNPADVAFDYHVATVSIQHNRLDDAEMRLKRVVAKRPNHPLALNNLAWLLAVQNKPGAVEPAQKAVDLMPDKPALLDTLALALASDKQYDKALQTQRRAIELAPDDSGLRLNLARIALQSGDKTLARNELQRLKALGTDFDIRNEVDRLMKQL